jgi:hypothetical protein
MILLLEHREVFHVLIVSFIQLSILSLKFNIRYCAIPLRFAAKRLVRQAE